MPCNQRILILYFFLFSTFVHAQSLTQTIRGTVVDQSLQTPLPGATVVILNSTPTKGASTDASGQFQLTQVPVGRQTLQISVVGYKVATLQNITVDAGKELVLTISLEEAVSQLSEITVKPTIEKDKPLNEMATVSARTFSVEETQKFAAAVNDPARMATAYAGVVGGDDGGNYIVIRGNAPNGLLWRMEGVEIPNPNHFSNLGSAGGGISILSAQLLANSDFLTGAFPAEYGNALSGVFDLKLRRGNNTKREYTVQVGVLGLDIAAEGPIAKNYNGSFLVNYRYSTLGLLSTLGLNIGTGTSIFQDLSFNVYLPTRKAGTFTLFGFGGLSSSKVNAPADSSKWETGYDQYNDDFRSNTGAAGITHTLPIGRKALLKTVLLASGYENRDRTELLDPAKEYTASERENDAYLTQKRIVSTTLTYKINPRHTFRTGLIGTQLLYDLSQKSWEPEQQQVLTRVQVSDQTSTLQAFGQWNYRLSEQLTLNAGLHYLRLNLNGTSALEPRGSVRWAFSPNKAISFGYGLHSQLQNPATYFVLPTDQSGSTATSNRNLGFTRSHHYVLAYDQRLNSRSDGPPLRLKVETYYQHLFNIPVSANQRDAFAIINRFDGFTDRALVNTGHGRNYGLELTLEQFLVRAASGNSLYFLLSSSLYNSEYQGSDGVWRNTRWNGRHAESLLVGNEWVSGSNVFGLNLKLSYYGGYQDTPVDLAESKRLGETVYIDNQSFTEQLPAYFRPDVRLSWKKNRPNSTRTLSLDLQNAINRQNIYSHYFDPASGTVKTNYATGMIPVLSYRVVF
ncbi:TonB-dependent receptor plug domain-containing protein [Spirosoma sp. HMF4905]|uniref:TonB-dependent receptor plug domain-containing protein n=1 Tax=Spirosoma arboris TaxID=2682092 RepID=A0A7K1SLY1_9BACT|nr:TonB-dependent receptor [Spirosoma arboris]MVM34811.1 TonB-dependent receptor plug domain-containing protein [Spirosoma arboris]